MSNFPYPKNNLNFTQFVFEKSATYFNHPLTPERVHALIPQAKVIILLADPIKRAYSWYQVSPDFAFFNIIIILLQDVVSLNFYVWQYV